MDLSDGKVRRRVNKALRERGVPAKACGKCFVVKGYEAFPRDSSVSDGRMSMCKRCSAETNRQWYAANRDRRAETQRQWYEANRDRVAETQRQWYEAWYAANRDRRAEANRQWREANRDRVAETARRRRARKVAATIEPFTATDLRHDWEDHDLWNCFFCGGSLEDLHVDHFYPLQPAGEGTPPGPHALFNLVPSCATCNLSKNNGDPWEFLREAMEARGVDLDACLTWLDEA